MRKVYYVDNISMHDIIKIEKNLYNLYRDAILDIKKSFSLCKCNIEIIDCWTTGDFENSTNIRPDLENKYVYWICYLVRYNGKPIVYDTENSQLTRSYCVLAISKETNHHKQKFCVKIFDDTKDVMEELMEDLSRIEKGTQRTQGDGSSVLD